MRFAGGFGFALMLAAVVGVQASSASAEEVIVYTYDALGRLVGVQRSGTVNSGAASTIQYDQAGNRISYTTTGVNGGVIFKQSFETGVPSLIQKSDGGSAQVTIVANAPLHGSAVARFGMVGSHVFALSSPGFVADQTTVTLSFYFRDSGVSNQSLTGWAGSTVDGAAPMLGGVYDLTNASWALDGWGRWSEVPMVYPPCGWRLGTIYADLQRT